MKNQQDSLKKRIDHHMAWALERLKARGELPPLTIIEPKSGPFQVFATTWANNREKQLLMQMIQVAGVACDAESISTIMEAWVAAEAYAVPGESAEQALRRVNSDPNHRPPSEREDRREVVLCQILYRCPIDGTSRRVHSEMREIERDATGNPCALAPDPYPGPSVGRVTDLMLPDRPDALMQRKAQQANAVLMQLLGVTADIIPVMGSVH